MTVTVSSDLLIKLISVWYPPPEAINGIYKAATPTAAWAAAESMVSPDTCSNATTDVEKLPVTWAPVVVPNKS